MGAIGAPCPAELRDRHLRGVLAAEDTLNRGRRPLRLSGDGGDASPVNRAAIPRMLAPAARSRTIRSTMGMGTDEAGRAGHPERA